MTDRYTYPILAAEVIDGDTFRLTIDVGLRLTAKIPVRLNGWDTPEKRSTSTRKVSEAEKQAALRAESCADDWLFYRLDDVAMDRCSLWVRTEKDPEVYGRWLGDVWAEDEHGVIHLGEELAQHDLATRWPERWYQVFIDGEATA